LQSIRVKFTEVRNPGYDILLEPGFLVKSGGILQKRFPGHTPFIISSPAVYGLYGKTLQKSLKKAGFPEAKRYLLPDGEENKNLGHFCMATAGLSWFSGGQPAKPLVLLLGGGVVGDLGGFVAACFRRGAAMVQIPTTLLAMVDSSVGGKLGVDLHTQRGTVKNLVGAFYQPSLVLVDLSCLRSLPAREVRCGLAEAVKMAVLFDPGLFRRMEQGARDLLALKPALLSDVIRLCAAHKARLVQRDEFDRKGERALLNLGHTFGHGVESASRFRVRHGEAVAFGLACACDLSRLLGLSGPKAGLERVEALLGRLGLATRLSRISPVRVLDAMRQDKKFEGELKFVLPVTLGRSRLVTVRSLSKVQEVLASRLA
jgi:3-dehydroquinate synthase